MENARIGIIEDDTAARLVLRRSLELFGHTVADEHIATSMPEALGMLGRLVTGELDIAVVDGNLTSGVLTGTDGAQVVSLFQEEFPDIITIGHSANGEVQGADLQVPKCSELVVWKQTIDQIAR